MNLSLVICTRNRASQLDQSLKSLLRLRSGRSWQLVVVDNGSTDDTQLVLERFRTHFTHEFTLVVEPRPGLGTARNRGWTNARGEIVAFTDDDCYPDEHFLMSVESCFNEDSRLGFAGGRVLLHDPTDYTITIQTESCRQEILPGQFIPAGLIQGANFACRRAALADVSGFDERFGAGTLFPCEDVDILARMSVRGWPGVYDPRLLVYHHHRRKSEEEVLRLKKQYDRGRGAYYAKCMLNPALRMTYLKNWYWLVRRQSPWRTARELIASAEFLGCAGAARLTGPK